MTGAPARREEGALAAKQFAEKVERMSSRAQRGLPAAVRDLLFS